MASRTRPSFGRKLLMMCATSVVLVLALVVAHGQAPVPRVRDAAHGGGRRPGATLPPESRYPRQTWPMLESQAGQRRFRAVTFDGHVHTAYSHDARHPIIDVVMLAERVGLDALMITDHGTSRGDPDVRDYAGATTPIMGAEMGGRYGHALTWGYVDVPHRRSETDVMEMSTLAAYVHAQNGLVVLAHPGWFIDGNHVNPRYYMQYDVIRRGGRGEQIDGIEIWNAMYAAPTEALLDDWMSLLDRNVYVPITGGTDFHAMGSIVDLGAPRNVALCAVGANGALVQSKRQCVLEAARMGRHYMTDGPSIDLQVEGKVLGEVVQPAVGDTITIDVRAIAWQGGNLRVRLGHTDVRTFALTPGQERVEHIRVRVTADTYVFATIERTVRVERKSMLWLITNPIRIDVAPFVTDWRGPVVTDSPARIPREWTRAGLRDLRRAAGASAGR